MSYCRTHQLRGIHDNSSGGCDWITGMTAPAEAAYKELNSRKGILDGIEDEELITEICESVAAAVLGAHEDQRVRQSLGARPVEDS